MIRKSEEKARKKKTRIEGGSEHTQTRTKQTDGKQTHILHTVRVLLSISYKQHVLVQYSVVLASISQYSRWYSMIDDTHIRLHIILLNNNTVLVVVVLLSTNTHGCDQRPAKPFIQFNSEMTYSLFFASYCVVLCHCVATTENFAVPEYYFSLLVLLQRVLLYMYSE